VFDKKCRLRPRHHQVSDKIDETQKSAEQTRERPRAATCSQKAVTLNDISERPVFGPALPPEMQEERQRSRDGGAAYDDGHVRTWISQDCNLEYADPRVVLLHRTEIRAQRSWDTKGND
jgi:hypothetical protein